MWYLAAVEDWTEAKKMKPKNTRLKSEWRPGKGTNEDKEVWWDWQENKRESERAICIYNICLQRYQITKLMNKNWRTLVIIVICCHGV